MQHFTRLPIPSRLGPWGTEVQVLHQASRSGQLTAEFVDEFAKRLVDLLGIDKDALRTKLMTRGALDWAVGAVNVPNVRRKAYGRFRSPLDARVAKAAEQVVKGVEDTLYAQTPRQRLAAYSMAVHALQGIQAPIATAPVVFKRESIGRYGVHRLVHGM